MFASCAWGGVAQLVVGQLIVGYPFSHSAAACACMARLALRKRLLQTEEELIARFRPQYELWREHPGMADTAMVCDIARSLGLAKSVQVLRWYERVLHCVHHAQVTGVLAFTEKFIVPGGVVVPRYDCSIIEAMTSGGFTLWTPVRDESPMVRKHSPADWDLMLAHAIVLA